MSADKIRGLTVEIAASAASFNKSMNSMRKDAKYTQKDFDALQKSLELEFDATKFARAQQVAQQAIDQTAQQADALRQRLAYLEKAGKTDTTEYRKLQSELSQAELKGKQLEEQLKKLNNIKLKKVTSEIKEIGSKTSEAGQALMPLSLASGAAIAGLGALGVNAVSNADEIATLAKQYGMSAEALQRFNYIALQTDTSNEALYKSFVKMRSALANMEAGTTSVSSTALKNLGFDPSTYQSSEEQFYAIIQTLAEMEDQTLMVSYANNLFGEELANAILPLIYAGSDAVAAYSAEYENLGALTDEDVTKLAEFDNVMNRVNTQLSNAALQAGAALLPVMELLADFIGNRVAPILQDLADLFASMPSGMQATILGVLGLIAVIAPLLMVIGKTATGISALIQLFSSLKAAQLQAALGFAAIFAAAALAFDIITGWENMTWVEKLLKSLALAALVAAAAVSVFHASWSLGLAIGAISAGVVAAIAAMNSARSEILPESESFAVSDFDVTNGSYSPPSFLETDAGELENVGTVYDLIGAGGTTGDIYNNDYSTHTTEQNVTVVIENYAEDVDVDELVRQINIKLAEEM